MRNVKDIFKSMVSPELAQDIATKFYDTFLVPAAIAAVGTEYPLNEVVVRLKIISPEVTKEQYVNFADETFVSALTSLIEDNGWTGLKYYSSHQGKAIESDFDESCSPHQAFDPDSLVTECHWHIVVTLYR